MTYGVRTKFVLWSLALACLLLSPLAMAQDDTYVVGIEPAYAPWAFVEDGQYRGIATDAVRAMAKQQGFKVEFKSLPFSSLIPALKAGKIDILATALTVSKKRAQKIDFTVPWWGVNMDVLVRKDSDDNIITALSAGKHVGTMSATTDYHWLENNLKKNGVAINLRGYPKATTIVHDLIIGRLDSAVLDHNPAQGFLAEHGDDLRLAGIIHPKPPQVYALGVQKGNEKLLGLLNKAVVDLYTSGKWAQVVHAYLPGVSIHDVPLPMPDGIPSYQKPIPGLN